MTYSTISAASLLSFDQEASTHYGKRWWLLNAKNEALFRKSIPLAAISRTVAEELASSLPEELGKLRPVFIIDAYVPKKEGAFNGTLQESLIPGH